MKSIRTGKHQYGVLPFRLTSAARPEVLLITSRGTGRWVIPKGWPMVGKTPEEAAMIEAYEEAGLTGRILGERRVGAYRVQKLLPSGLVGELTVRVFLMEVEQQLETWPEQAERVSDWFSPMEASALVAEPALAKLVRRLPRLLRQASGSA